ncbi:MAG TPA: DUF4917 family protein [Actinomycetota bacterium]
MSLDDSLASWDEVAPQFHHALLVGNGASIAVSASFAYPSLLEIASSSLVANRLSPDERAVFESTNDTNFERVLGELATAAVLAEQVGLDATPLRERYARIRRALIEAVHAVHPRHGDLPEERFERVQESLLHFSEVFTTNYDLQLYWAITSTKRMDDFRDFFWNPGLAFDLTNTWTPEDKVRVFYLHGALHLFHLPNGTTVKATGGDDNPWSPYVPLLDLTFEYKEARYPLFVSEGSTEQKMAAITSNAYLGFAYETWNRMCWDWSSTLVIFGHGCGAQDEHICAPIKARVAKSQERDLSVPKIAVSIAPRDSDHVIARKLHYREKFHEDIVFFDARTHPLGQPTDPPSP